MRHIESSIQQACIKWFRLQHPHEVLFAVPNGGKRNAREAVRLKAEGVLSGVSDLIWVRRDYCIFIELKAGSGRQTPEQIIFEQSVVVRGHIYIIVKSFDAFKANIEFHLKLHNEPLF